MIHNLNPGDSLQNAVDFAAPGDRIVLPAGATFPAPQLRDKSGEVVLTSSGQLPDRRVTPEDAHLMATLTSGSSAPALEGAGARNWLVDGIRCLPNVFGQVVSLTDASKVRLYRLLIDVPEGTEQKRGILANGNSISIEGCHVAGIQRPGQDSQAICAWEGDGLDILDCFLEAASENVLIGGADARSEAFMSRNVRIEGNHLFKRLAWKIGRHQVKNLLELKAVLRALILNNTLENNWSAPDGQSGFGIVFTPRNQDGAAPFARLEDITFAGNRATGMERGVNITGHDNDHPSGRTTRITVRDNVIDSLTYGFLLDKEIGDVAIYRNTLTTPNVALSFENLAESKMWKAGEAAPRLSAFSVENLTWADNQTPGYIHSHVAVGYPGTLPAAVALKAFVKNPTVLTVPSDAPPPLPAIPDVVNGLPDPVPGTKVDAPSVPTPAPDPLQVELAKFRVEVAVAIEAVSNRVAASEAAATATKDDLRRLRAYLGAIANSSKIQQVVAYIRGAK